MEPNKTMERAAADTRVESTGTITMGPDGFAGYRILTIKMGMELEMKGERLTRGAPSCFTIARREFGLRGNKPAIYRVFCAMHGLETCL